MRTRKIVALALLTLAGLSVLAATAASWGRGGQNQGQPGEPDPYALRETAADLPAGWKLWPDSMGFDYVAKYIGAKPDLGRELQGKWMGSVMRAGDPPSPMNKILSACHVWITTCDSPGGAMAAMRTATQATQVRPVSGSYSGQAIGDRCLRGANRPGDDSSGTLWFTRGSVCYEISIGGPYGSTGYRAAAESLAVALVKRYDAVAALSAVQPASSTVGGQAVAGRSPSGVPVVLLSAVDGLSGTKVAKDIPGGTATLTGGAHTLVLHIGRTEATLDGKTIALPFPALRSGPSDVWCPVATLRSLGL